MPYCLAMRTVVCAAARPPLNARTAAAAANAAAKAPKCRRARAEYCLVTTALLNAWCCRYGGQSRAVKRVKCRVAIDYNHRRKQTKTPRPDHDREQYATRSLYRL